jgi:flagellin-like hook-associated protein FlgL
VHRTLALHDGRVTSSVERLASGYRINRAADDASGLAISEGLRSQIGGLKVAVRNAQDGISEVQTAEGALAETHSVLQRMRDLTVQAATTGGLSDDARATLQAELGALKDELDRIAGTTWNGTKLLDGSFSASFQLGTHAEDALRVTLGTAMTATGLGLEGIDVGAGGGRYAFNPAVGSPAPGQVSVYTEAVNTFSSAVLHFADPDGQHFEGAGASPGAYLALDGVIGFGGRTFDLSSVAFDTSADTDADGTVDTDDLLAQLNAAAMTAFDLVVPPFLAQGDRLAFFISAGEPTWSAILPVTAGDSAADIVRATPTFGPGSGTTAVRTIDAAIATVSAARGELGAVQNRFERTIEHLGVSLENLTASESRIRDVDVAQESMQFARNQILVQAGTAMLAQANRAPQALLALLN